MSGQAIPFQKPNLLDRLFTGVSGDGRRRRAQGPYRPLGWGRGPSPRPLPPGPGACSPASDGGRVLARLWPTR
jgi:hypothetical protein